MGATSKLLALYRVDQQLRGVKSRLDQAQRFLRRQEHLAGEIETKHEAVKAQIRQLEAASHNADTEVRSLDERIESLRDRMNNARSHKEHQATLTEINTLKADRSGLEDTALEHITSLEELRERLTELEAELKERLGVRDQAMADRDAKAAEIEGRVKELETERATKASDCPADALREYEDRMEMGLDDVMAPVIEEDRRNMVYISEASNQALPIELVNKLLLREGIVIDPFSDAILYLPDDLRESLENAAEKKRKKKAAEASA
ncbi:MAG: hypothetical protein AAGI30_11820 [Planctomycetota bacterium]